MANTFNYIILGVVAILLIIIYLQPTVITSPGGFIEECDAWDSSLWGKYWNMPEVIDGTWVFNFPASTSKTIQAVRSEMTGYGTYKIRFKTSGHRISGVNYYVFLYNENKEELDIPELWGNHESLRMSICSWHNGVLKYWYFDSPIYFEDGEYHYWECTYTKQEIIFKVDDKIAINIIENPEAQMFAEPPMQLIIGGSNKDGSNVQDFQFIVDSIEYKKI